MSIHAYIQLHTHTYLLPNTCFACSRHLRWYTLPPIILCTGRPAMVAGRANCVLHFGQVRSWLVKSLTILSSKHFTSAPVPFFLYTYNFVVQVLQKILIDVVGIAVDKVRRNSVASIDTSYCKATTTPTMSGRIRSIAPVPCFGAPPCAAEGRAILVTRIPG